MFSVDKIKQNLQNIQAKNTWKHWELKKADNQDHTQYISIVRLIELNTRSINIEGCICRQKLSDGLQEAVKRPSRIQIKNKAIEACFYVSLISAVSHTILPPLLLPSSYHIPSARTATGSIALTFFCIFTLLNLQRENIQRDNLQKPLKTYFNEKDQNKAKIISNFLKKIKENNPQIYVNEADSVIKKIGNEYWKSDNWEIGLITSHEYRKAVSYLGQPPSGDILFQKSEMKKMNFKVERVKKKPAPTATIEDKTTSSKSAEKVQAQLQTTEDTKQKKHNRNSRKCANHKDVFSSKEKLWKALEIIDQRHPITKDENRYDLNPKRNARANAMHYLSKNYEYFKEIQKNPEKFYNLDEKYVQHRKGLLKIFSPIASNQNTLKEAGEHLLENFIYLKDRTLDTWLHELGWTIDSSK